MTTNSRLPKNKSLPKYWRMRQISGKTYYTYRIPPHLRSRFEGKKELSLGSSLTGAYKKYAEITGVDECVTTLNDMLDRYLFEVVPEYESANTRDSKQRSIVRIRRVLGENLLTAIDSELIRQYKHHIGNNFSKTRANRDLETLSHVFSTAIEWGIYRQRHPMIEKQVTKFSLNGRDRYVEDWELEEWAKAANPFLVIYVKLKGLTGLRQQDLLTIQRRNITETEMKVVSLKRRQNDKPKILRFPLVDKRGDPTAIKEVLDEIDEYYASIVRRKLKRPKLQHLPPVASSPWLFYTRTGDCYYDLENRKAPGFRAIWQRSMKKALEKTELQESFSEHDLRAKVASDVDSDLEAQAQLAHSSAATTNKHYRRNGTVVQPAQGFFGRDENDS